jgi:dTDP-4-amino-4,6-dideoxygalactose transaminase
MSGDNLRAFAEMALLGERITEGPMVRELERYLEGIAVNAYAIAPLMGRIGLPEGRLQVLEFPEPGVAVIKGATEAEAERIRILVNSGRDASGMVELGWNGRVSELQAAQCLQLMAEGSSDLRARIGPWLSSSLRDLRRADQQESEPEQ